MIHFPYRMSSKRNLPVLSDSVIRTAVSSVNSVSPSRNKPNTAPAITLPSSSSLVPSMSPRIYRFSSWMFTTSPSSDTVTGYAFSLRTKPLAGWISRTIQVPKGTFSNLKVPSCALSAVKYAFSAVYSFSSFRNRPKIAPAIT